MQNATSGNCLGSPNSCRNLNGSNGVCVKVDKMAFSSVLQMYLGWANTVLHEDEDIIDGFHQLRDGQVFCQLIDILTGSVLRQKVNSPDQNGEDTVKVVLDYLQEKGIQVKTTEKAIVSGELKGILDVMWALILHFTVHSEDRAAYQRTVWIGKKMLLQWCMEELPDAEIQTNKSLALNFQDNNYLAKLIYKHCPFGDFIDRENDYVSNLTSAVLAAEDKLGIKKSFISPADVVSGNVDDHALLLYLALLHRKVSQGMPLSNRTQSTLPFTSEEESESGNEDDVIKSLQVKGEANEDFKIEDLTDKDKNIYIGLTNSSNRHGYGSTALQLVLEQQATSEAAIKSLQGYLQSLEELKNEASHLDTSVDKGNSTITSLTSLSDSTVQELDTDSGVSPSDRGPLRHSTPAVPEEQQDCAVSQKDLNDARKQLVETLLAVDSLQSSDFNSSDSKGEERALSPDISSPTRFFRRKQSGTGDELLDVLEAIGKECNQLREELALSAKRELSLQQELQNFSASGKASPEDKVIGKLVQELEILRAENRRLFRETANAKSSNSSDKRSVDGLKKTVQKLQSELEQSNSENFALKFKQRLREVHEETGTQEFDKSPNKSDSFNQFNGEKDIDNFMENLHIDGLPDTTNVRELKQHIASAKYESHILRDKLDTTNTDMTAKLNQTFEDLKTTKEESQKVEQENKLLKMAAETNKSEIESLKVKIAHLQKALLDAEERNNKQTSELEELRQILGPDSTEQQLKRENSILREKLQLAEEDRDILRHELTNYRTTQSILESSLSYRDRHVGSYENEQLEVVSRKQNEEILKSSYQEPTPNLPLKNPRHGRNQGTGQPVSMEMVSRKLDVEVQSRNRAPSPWEHHSNSERYESSRKHGHGRRHTIGDPVTMETRKQEEPLKNLRGRSLTPTITSGVDTATRQSLRTRSLSPAYRQGQIHRGQRSHSQDNIDSTRERPSKTRSSHRGHSSERSRSKETKPSSGRKEGRRRKDPSPRRTETDSGRKHRDRVDGYDNDLPLVNGDVGNADNMEDEEYESDGLSERSFRPEDFVNEFSGSRTDRSEKRREVEHWLKEEIPATNDYNQSNVMYGRLPKTEEQPVIDNFVDYSTAGGDYISDIAYGQLPYTQISDLAPEIPTKPQTAVKTTTVSGSTRDSSSRRYRSNRTTTANIQDTPVVTRDSSYTAAPSYSSTQTYKTDSYTPSSRRYPAPVKTTYTNPPSYSDSYTRSVDAPKPQTKPSYSAVSTYTTARTYTRPTYTTTATATATSTVTRSHHTPTTYATPAMQTSSKVSTAGTKLRYERKYEMYSEAPPASVDSSQRYNGYTYSPPEHLSKENETPNLGRIKFGQLPVDTSPPISKGYADYLSTYTPDTNTRTKGNQDTKLGEERKYFSHLPPRAPPKVYSQSPTKINGFRGDDTESFSYRKTLTPEKPGKVVPESPSKISVVGSEISSNGPLSISELQSSPKVGLVKNGYSSSTPALHQNGDDPTFSTLLNTGNHSYYPKSNNLESPSSNSLSKLDDPTFSSTKLSNNKSSTLKPTTYSSPYSYSKLESSKPVSSLTIDTSSENTKIPPPPLSPSNLNPENSGSALLDKFRNVALTPEQEQYANSLIDKYMSTLT